jgi:hypothetical protein
MRSECSDFVRKPEERRPRGTPRRIEEYNIKNLLKIKFEGQRVVSS